MLDSDLHLNLFSVRFRKHGGDVRCRYRATYRKERCHQTEQIGIESSGIGGSVLEGALCSKNVHASIQTRIDRVSSSEEVR